MFQNLIFYNSISCLFALMDDLTKPSSCLSFLATHFMNRRERFKVVFSPIFFKGGAKRHRKILRDNIQGITKPAIRRLARRGGVKRISGLSYLQTDFPHRHTDSLVTLKYTPNLHTLDKQTQGLQRNKNKQTNKQTQTRQPLKINKQQRYITLRHENIKLVRVVFS